jgi:hypothetical protein
MALTPRFTSVWQTLGVSVRALIPGNNSITTATPANGQRTQGAFPPESGPAWAQIQLSSLIGHYGQELTSAPGRCERLVRMRCGSYRSEADLLCTALSAGVPGEIIRTRDSGPSALGPIAETLASNLAASRGISGADAKWAVEAWVAALAGSPDGSASPSESYVSPQPMAQRTKRGPTGTIRNPKTQYTDTDA